LTWILYFKTVQIFDVVRFLDFSNSLNYRLTMATKYT
jgi:hypothetical protein